MTLFLRFLSALLFPAWWLHERLDEAIETRRDAKILRDTKSLAEPSGAPRAPARHLDDDFWSGRDHEHEPWPEIPPRSLYGVAITPDGRITMKDCKMEMPDGSVVPIHWPPDIPQRVIVSMDPGGADDQPLTVAEARAGELRYARLWMNDITEADTQPYRIEDIPVPFDPADDAGCPLYVEAMAGADLFAPQLKAEWERGIIQPGDEPQHEPPQGATAWEFAREGTAVPSPV